MADEIPPKDDVIRSRTHQWFMANLAYLSETPGIYSEDFNTEEFVETKFGDHNFKVTDGYGSIETVTALGKDNFRLFTYTKEADPDTIVYELVWTNEHRNTETPAIFEFNKNSYSLDEVKSQLTRHMTERLTQEQEQLLERAKLALPADLELVEGQYQISDFNRITKNFDVTFDTLDPLVKARVEIISPTDTSAGLGNLENPEVRVSLVRPKETTLIKSFDYTKLKELHDTHTHAHYAEGELETLKSFTENTPEREIDLPAQSAVKSTLAEQLRSQAESLGLKDPQLMNFEQEGNSYHFKGKANEEGIEAEAFVSFERQSKSTDAATYTIFTKRLNGTDVLCNAGSIVVKSTEIINERPDKPKDQAPPAPSAAGHQSVFAAYLYTHDFGNSAMLQTATMYLEEHSPVIEKFMESPETHKFPVYKCQAGVETTGFGSTTVPKGEDIPKGIKVEGRDLLMSEGSIDGPTALKWMNIEIDHKRETILGEVGPAHKALAPHEKDAIVSFAYNSGSLGGKGSNTCKAVRAYCEAKLSGDETRIEETKADVTKMMSKWVYVDDVKDSNKNGSKTDNVISEGLIARRSFETAWFNGDQERVVEKMESWKHLATEETKALWANAYNDNQPVQVAAVTAPAPIVEKVDAPVAAQTEIIPASLSPAPAYVAMPPSSTQSGEEKHASDWEEKYRATQQAEIAAATGKAPEAPPKKENNQPKPNTREFRPIEASQPTAQNSESKIPENVREMADKVMAKANPTQPPAPATPKMVATNNHGQQVGNSIG